MKPDNSADWPYSLGQLHDTWFFRLSEDHNLGKHPFQMSLSFLQLLPELRYNLHATVLLAHKQHHETVLLDHK